MFSLPPSFQILSIQGSRCFKVSCHQNRERCPQFLFRNIGKRQARSLFVRLAREFAEWVRADDRFEVVAPVPLNLVCFRHRGGDAANEAILDRVNRSGELFMTHTRLDDRLVLRMSIGGARTERRHVEAAWAAIRAAAGD